MKKQKNSYFLRRLASLGKSQGMRTNVCPNFRLVVYVDMFQKE